MSLIEVRDEGDIRWIGLNRPDKRNAIDAATSNAFSAALDGAAPGSPARYRLLRRNPRMPLASPGRQA
jgi:enoyl-CoA hydratase/carnithine racemase